MEVLQDRPSKLRRSVLYVPADNPRALAKSTTLEADCIVYDLEDAIAPDKKASARESLRTHFAAHPFSQAERAIRINDLSTEWGTEDLMAVRAIMPDALVLPKVSSSADVLAVCDALSETDAPLDLEIMAMIETARGVLNIGEIAELGRMNNARLTAFIVGMNDLIKETRIAPENARTNAHPWLMQIVLAARAGGIDVIDGVFNDFRDGDGFAAECAQSLQMGFDGKSLIHPTQIDGANAAFMPSEQALIEAGEIVEAFRQPENADKGVINLDGKMVERLHLAQAEVLLAKAAILRGRMKDYAASEPTQKSE